MQSVEICLSGKWFEAINVSSHNIDGLLFCTIVHSALAVENDLVSVDILLPQDRVRWFAFAKKPISVVKTEQERIAAENAEAGRLLKESEKKVSDGGGKQAEEVKKKPISFKKTEQERIAAENAEAGKLLKESEKNVSEGDLLREVEKQVEEAKIFSTLTENADAEESGSTTDKKIQQKVSCVVKSNTEQSLHPERLTNSLISEAPAVLSDKATILPNSGRTQMTIDTIEEESYYFITKDLTEIKHAWEEADLGSLHDEDFKLYLNSKVYACEFDPSDKTMNVRFGNHDTQWFPVSCLYQGKTGYKNQSGKWK